MSNNEYGPRKRRKLSPPEPGAYVLRRVLDNIPLKAEDEDEDVSIECVEYWNNNLYIGTSASEILHFVALPADPSDEPSPPTFILASRLQPSGHDLQKDALGRRGVQQILLIPSSSKACALCNGTVSFYSLPELSPAFPNKEPTNVQWIGGIDQNLDLSGGQEPVLMIANSKRILCVRIGDKLRPAGANIDFPGCLRSTRRDTIACVADSKGYSLLEVEHRQKIPLFPIASDAVGEELPDDNAPNREASRSPPEGAGHGRSTSLGNVIGSAADRTHSPRPLSTPDGRLLPPRFDSAQGRDQSQSPSRAGTESPTSRQRSSTDSLPTRPKIETQKNTSGALKPHIVTPLPSEFMLTTGTSPSEPGVGMFVNVDGDVVPRGTVEFPSYPEAILVDNKKPPNPEAPSPDDEQQVIVALLRREVGGREVIGLHIQALPDESAAVHSPPYLMQLPTTAVSPSSGLHRALDSQDCDFADVPELMRAVPVRLNKEGVLSEYDAAEPDPRTSSAVQQHEEEKALFENSNGAATPPEERIEVITKRIDEEWKFVKSFGKSSSRQMLWSGEHLWHIVPNPLLLQLEARIQNAVDRSEARRVDAKALLSLLASLRGREAIDEVEFLSLSYIRQKVSLILFIHLMSLFASKDDLAENQSAIENAMLESMLDPRVVLLLNPPLALEVSQGKQGMWLQQGIADACSSFQSPIPDFKDAPIEFWMMIRHYLTAWQEKRGYGSITDEKLVFDSVDSALLLTLLYLDHALPRNSGVQASVRAKLNNVVDHWKGDFDRAVSMLERYQRLYVLSRLYQSKKQAKHVLATWRRIVEGEADQDYPPNSPDLELQIKRYLTVIRDTQLIQDYGIWLAHRNPPLGVEVFADSETSRVKFDPHEVVRLLKEHAPSAVQLYLEHLVFKKNLDRYADDLIGYYLDSVLSVLESSPEAKESLAQTYTVYRALPSPKPTYLNFIRDNAPPEPWWQSRLRLLQLLGSGGYETSSNKKELPYSVPLVLARLQPFSSYLVSESIILDARQGRHEEALRLLTHGLGDYDSAVRYCYFGGPTVSSGVIDASSLPPRAQQESLFAYLFQEFLQIADPEDCLEHTSQLLGKFATYFDPLEILLKVPDEWSVGMLSEFLVRSFRAATSKRNEAVIVKALSAAQNLQVQTQWVEACEKIGATIEAEKGLDGGAGGGDAGMEGLGEPGPEVDHNIEVS
ncbi:Transforming growth factor-beta receptor-associated protein 1 [Cyphellophora attinorum]|uniref:Transforming growth factor-beta receptor-associated protein 1 n=1 Tax=Cyphellophora attinorum TaxID=1664694 RepID=A0A0N1HFE2_9EURO|nr:Transforming growth factor-beta receptor-associated protein 1 [Phialophora attinorum]KPI43904.1 Transforming growth factor-beta receptor-associated protein 1 [Phialophora attinorum]